MSEINQLDAMSLAWNNALDALKALARDEAEVLFNEQGDQIGVRWWDPQYECWEAIYWGSPD